MSACLTNILDFCARRSQKLQLSHSHSDSYDDLNPGNAFPTIDVEDLFTILPFLSGEVYFQTLCDFWIINGVMSWAWSNVLPMLVWRNYLLTKVNIAIAVSGTMVMGPLTCEEVVFSLFDQVPEKQ